MKPAIRSSSFLAMVLFVAASSASAEEKTLLARNTTPGASPTSSSSEGTTSETRSNANVLSIELLGRAALYSLNYDHMVSDSVALGAGLAYWPGSSNDLFILPLYVNAYPIRGENRFYLTGGLDIGITTGSYIEMAGSEG